MELFLVRHGLAEAGDPYNKDRQLTERGLKQVEGAARWVKQQVSSPVVVWASPYYRTLQTAEPFEKLLGSQVVPHRCLEPDQTPQKVIDELTESDQSIVLVTHLPLVGRLASVLIDGQIFDQPWSPAEVWHLTGDVAAAACMESKAVWYPVLEGL